jgi:16S rRNA (guanine527-N7)-methyltransferase
MNDEQRDLLVRSAAVLGVTLDAAAVARFSKYLALLQQWGKKINLTTRLEASEIVVYHFVDSLAGAPRLAETPSARIVDLGAGAGLPAFPLKFALPGLQILLVESVRKKVAFCQEAIRATGLTGIEALWGRGEEMGLRPAHHGAYDWAVSRALGAAADVARLALPFLAPGGRMLFYKGEPESGELAGLDDFCKEIGGSWELHKVVVPHLDAARSLIVVACSRSRK